MKIGLLPLGRPTFDVAYAEAKLAAMLDVIDRVGHATVGPRSLCMDGASAAAAVGEALADGAEQLLVLQVTFTDAAAVVDAGRRFAGPLGIWAVPEPRAGGRLRLNAFCGLNLASHALGRAGRRFSWAYAAPDDEADAVLADLLAGRREAGRLEAKPAKAGPEGERIVAALRGRRIARIGAHPDGFDTCDYDADTLHALAGVEVQAMELDTLFDAARALPAERSAQLARTVGDTLTGLDAVDGAELDRSFRLKEALEDIRASGGFDAFALRCWPETFTEYGGAICAPAGMMGEGGVPCACEADVYGALTQLLLREAAGGASVFLTDLVDIDAGDGTGVVWHCGQAPMSMRDPDCPAEATIHTNRKKPLLYQFTLKPGPVTFVRVSQAFNEPKLVIGAGEMLRRPMAFTGTSGVIRFDRPASAVLGDVIATGLEHHVALAYGDHRPALREAAGALGLGVLEI